MQQRPGRSRRLVSSLTMLAIVTSLVVAGAPASQAVNVAQTKIVNPNPDELDPQRARRSDQLDRADRDQGLRRRPVHAGPSGERRHDLLEDEHLRVRTRRPARSTPRSPRRSTTW